MTLDIHLPDIEGWRLLERLKNDVNTRHIPVWAVSTEEMCERALGMGAVDYLRKPIQTLDCVDELIESVNNYATQEFKNVLVIEPDANHRKSITDMIKQDDIRVSSVGTGRQALTRLRKSVPDCLVISPQLSDISLGELMDSVREPSLRACPCG
jgi:CheY-like chemotaxis protein